MSKELIRKEENMNIWETQLGYNLVQTLIRKLSKKETTQKSKMYYSAQEAESEINTEIKNNNARVLSVTAVGECVLVVYEMPA